MARQVLDNGVILPSEYSDDWYDDMTSNLTKLDEVIGSDAEKLDESDVGEAAISNDYDDLDNKPSYNVLRRAAVTLTAGGTGNYTDLDSDSKIKAGDYVLDASNKLYSITAIDAANSTYTVSAAAIINITDKSELGAAALSNSYDDLSNLPGYGILRFCSTAITDNSSVPFATISSVSKIAAGDFLLDTAAKLYTVSAVDTVNQTVSVTTPLTQLAVDSSVMHLSGDETAAGIKTFSNDLIISLIKSVTNLTTGSSAGNNILPLVASITYTDGTATKTAKLNFRIQSDGSIALYPDENGLYSLGLASSNWDVVYSYMFKAFGKQLGNEFSGNARTNLYLKANRDTGGQSGVYVSKFRQNRAQGEMGGLDVVQVSFDVLENSVRTNRTWYLNYLNWENDVPKTLEVRSLCEKVDYKLTRINDLNPGCLSLPDLNNGIDISGYITDLTGAPNINKYTPTVDGWVSIGLPNADFIEIYIPSSLIGGTFTKSSINNYAQAFMPVIANKEVRLALKGTSIGWAKFYPCQGNV